MEEEKEKVDQSALAESVAKVSHTSFSTTFS